MCNCKNCIEAMETWNKTNHTTVLWVLEEGSEIKSFLNKECYRKVKEFYGSKKYVGNNMRVELLSFPFEIIERETPFSKRKVFVKFG